jgi:hypothetical protein
MQVDTHALAQLLSLSGLLGGTIEYAEIIKRRALRRRTVAARDEGADVGLHGLVRVFLADEAQGGESPKP